METEEAMDTGLLIAFLITVVAFVVYHKILGNFKLLTRGLIVSVLPIHSEDDEGRWFNLTTVGFRLYVYSAFYDDRPSLLSTPVVRIIAISDDFVIHERSPLYCALYHGLNDVKVLRMKEEPRPVGFGRDLNKRRAKEYVYTCPTVGGKIPSSLSVVEQQGDNVTSWVPVTLPRKPAQKLDFGVCVQVAYGSLEPHRLIEWLEFQKILGVSLVGVYDLSISEAGLKVLRHYSSEGFVDLRKTKAIYEHDDRHYLLQGALVINDCLYRHIYEFHRIVVIDFDEIIMPRRHKNLSELVSYLDQKSPKVNYVFRNNYFFLDLPPDNAISPSFTVLRFRKKVLISPDRYCVKSIINPLACTHMHNHYCRGLTANYSRRHESIDSVDPGIALNQHYRKCNFSEAECRTMMQNVTQDDVMLPFRDVITERVNAKIRTIMG